MDDSCAVCAEALEWVAYGACGHRDVCSTCVARLRFICNDRRCCICKAESDVVFVTKALGEYTRMINDFKLLPNEPKEGRVGRSYWYHEDTQAFFDDSDHYRMIKAMCRLSCSVCDKLEEGNNDDGMKRRPRLRNIEQLKGHLFRWHRLLMCSLCLEGRKVFICEQKLYTRAQLNQHISTGDSEVDGDENERGGFMGHPMCEFCKAPFYGDNELYTHMSTEHYTCHICQRQHPGQYEYYKNYDDLEIHFRRDHFLCEDESCLSKKFVVFQTEAEMKRHNALEHGGRMSRSQRNAALQIPTSFRYRHYEQDQRRGRRRTFRRDQSDNQLSAAIQASLETAHLEGLSNDPSQSSSAQLGSDRGAADDFVDPIVQPFESLAVSDSETSARYLQALGQGGGNAPLRESSFPPLPMTSSGSEPVTKHESDGLRRNSMAERLRKQNNRTTTVSSSAQAWPAASRANILSSAVQNRSTLSTPLQTSQSSASVPPPSSFPSLSQVQVLPAAAQGNLASASGVPPQPSFPSLSQVQVQGNVASGSSRKLGNTSRVGHSASAPNLTDSALVRPTNLDFPPVSAVQICKTSPSNQASANVGAVHTANKSLVEKLRAALDNDEDRYTSFKGITAQYRQDSIDTGKYLEYVRQYGLLHLVPDLAKLCPDTQKQKELIDTYNASLRSDVLEENGWVRGSVHLKNLNKSAKGKGIASEDGNSKNRLADDIMSTVRSLQSNYKPVEEDVEVLSRDGYRSTKGKSLEIADEEQKELRAQSNSLSASDGSNRKAMDTSSGSKKGKKTSKFHRVRLGDGSMAARLDSEPEQASRNSEASDNPAVGLPVRGVWRKGGGQKLFS